MAVMPSKSPEPTAVTAAVAIHVASRRWLSFLGGMARIFAIIALLAATAGCTTSVRSTGTAPYPSDGICLYYSRDGRLIQKTVWRHGALVAAWEYGQREDLPREIIDAVNRGERDWPAPRWIQVVSEGSGRLRYLDEDGRCVGFADYYDGKHDGGAS